MAELSGGTVKRDIEGSGRGLSGERPNVSMPSRAGRANESTRKRGHKEVPTRGGVGEGGGRRAYTARRGGGRAGLGDHGAAPGRGRVLIARSVTDDNGRLIFDTPKPGEERAAHRQRFLAEQVAASVAEKGPDDLVFQGTRGGVLRNGNFNRRTFGPAAIAIGEPALTPHGLRHTAASLAIAAGGNVKVVQQMLGHATASMTLDLYGHLFPDQLDDVADRLDVIGRAAAEVSADFLRTKGPLTPLHPKTGRPL